MTTRAEPSTSRLLTIADLQRLLRCGRTTAYARTREPGFPRPLAISAAAYRWWEDEVVAWLETRRLDEVQQRERIRAQRRGLTDEKTDQGILPVPTPRPTRRRLRVRTE